MQIEFRLNGACTVDFVWKIYSTAISTMPAVTLIVLLGFALTFGRANPSFRKVAAISAFLLGCASLAAFSVGYFLLLRRYIAVGTGAYGFYIALVLLIATGLLGYRCFHSNWRYTPLLLVLLAALLVVNKF